MNGEDLVKVIIKYYPDRTETYANDILIEEREREDCDVIFYKTISLKDFEKEFGKY